MCGETNKDTRNCDGDCENCTNKKSGVFAKRIRDDVEFDFSDYSLPDGKE